MRFQACRCRFLLQQLRRGAVFGHTSGPGGCPGGVLLGTRASGGCSTEAELQGALGPPSVGTRVHPCSCSHLLIRTVFQDHTFGAVSSRILADSETTIL